MITNKKEYARQKSKEAAERNKKKNENRTVYNPKQCPKCKITKEPQFFTKDKTSKDGLYGICKACRKVQRKERYEKDYDVMKRKMKNMTGGIYTIKNKKENKIYVGQSIMIEQRRTQHFTDLRGKRHPNKQLQEDFNRLGEESFEHQVYQEVDKDDVLLIKLKELETMLKFRNDGWSLYNSEEQ
jgi:hypothetical protein